MATLVAFILAILAGMVALGMFVQGVRGKHDLINIRNIFLLGLMIFQLTSGTTSLLFRSYGDVAVSNPGPTSAIYLFIITTFLLIFWLAYEYGPIVRALAWRGAVAPPSTSPAALLPLAAVLLILGIIFRVVIGRNVPVLGILTDIMAIGLLASAAGLAAWVWTPRLLNPAVAVPAAAIILVAMGTVVFQTFGRRDVLGVMFTVILAAYHSQWKSLGILRMSYRFAAVAAIGLVFLAAFSTVRSATSKSTDIGNIAAKIGEADISKGLIQMAGGQFAAANSMWVIESRPKNHPFFPLHSVVYTVIQPIPRVIWPDKPKALGLNMVREARVYRYQKEFTLGPGIVGHIWNDNPYLALVPYAIFFGLACRFLDEYARANPYNPFAILAVAAGAGDIIGIPRGEVGLFTFRAIVSIATAWVALRLGYNIVMKFVPAPALPMSDGPEEHDGYADDQDPDDYRVPMAYDAPRV